MKSHPILELLPGLGALACMLVIFIASIVDVPEVAAVERLDQAAQVAHG